MWSRTAFFLRKTSLTPVECRQNHVEKFLKATPILPRLYTLISLQFPLQGTQKGKKYRLFLLKTSIFFKFFSTRQGFIRIYMEIQIFFYTFFVLYVSVRGIIANFAASSPLQF